MKRNIRENVRELLKLFPELSSNSNKLLLYYWVIFDGLKKASDAPELTSADTILRARRIVNKETVTITTSEFTCDFADLV